MTKINIFTENIFDGWNVDEKDVIDRTTGLLEYYIQNLKESSCLNDKEYDSITLDIVFCDSNKTQELNRDYRNKDYSADIITFAVFADSPDEEKFVLDMEINLGEVIIGLDRVIDEAEKKGVTKEVELLFLISHGIMHLLGFDHQTQEDFDFVVAHQKKALESIGIIYDKI